MKRPLVRSAALSFGPSSSPLNNLVICSAKTQKVNLLPMEFAYRAPVVGIIDANLAILSSDHHSRDK
jgi:capsular polysaccharide biosynthesis protein